MGSKEEFQAMKIETDLNIIQKLSEKNHEENWNFRSFLKGYYPDPKGSDNIVHRLYDAISNQIDCTSCANCCREISPILDQVEIKRFSKRLAISVSEFKSSYLKADKEETGKFTFNKAPCPFLKDNLCSYYEFRPNDCKSFPHLHKKDFVTRLWGVIENIYICPTAYNVYEYLKDELWHNDFDDYLDEYATESN